MACPACGFANADTARFCGSCGTSLAAGCPSCDAPLVPGHRFCTSCGEPVPDSHAGPVEEAELVEVTAERRRVSVLFVDVEDFTSLAERLDPEEIRTVQSRYFEAARSVVATYGGTIEKFIGDAVMAIWGAPVAHEDDAARAVRAALALVDAVGRLGGAASPSLSARGAVTSGEAAVTVGAPGHGMVAGDLVNAAARLQGETPPGGVLVDAATRELAGDVVEYEAVGALTLKGRAATLEAFRATSRASARPERQRGSHSGPFVGRARELRELIDLFEGVLRDGHSRLVSITGIAGIGKSRLAWELGEYLEKRPGNVYWHSGRAPAYGDQVTFAAVAEMVRRRLRIPDDAQPVIARRLLAAGLGEIVRDEEERRWMEPRLGVLLDSDGLAPYDRNELFAAWRRFFERISDLAPTILLFEDLQWADTSLLQFVEHLGAWTRQHPILIVTLARPELFDRRPNWGGTTNRFTAMHLEHLSVDAMRDLLKNRAPGLAGGLIRQILERAGGVPLYAVEVARILGSSPSETVDSTGADRRAAPRPSAIPAGVPDSLHGLIAARIDALAPPERRLLLAAAVLGRRFRPEALVAVAATDPAVVRDRIDELVRRELLTLDDELGSPGRGELGFVQDIVREVAYQTLAHTERRTIHLAAARYLEERPDDEVAESLAGHLVEAHHLAPDHPDARRIARRAVAALRRAAQNALRLHIPERALGHLQHALRLTDTPEQRAVVLEEAAAAGRAAGRLELAEAHLRELVAHHTAGRRRQETARARAQLASVLLMAQNHRPAIAELESALRAIRNFGAYDAGVELAAQLAKARMLVGDDAAGFDWAERALAAAERRGLQATATDALITRGTARFALGEEEEGLADLRRAISEAETEGYLASELRARNNLAWLAVVDDPRTTLDTAREAVELASTMGVGDIAVNLAEVATAVAVDTGDWQWALHTIEELDRGVIPPANRINLAVTTSIIHALQGDPQPLASIEALEPFPDQIDSQVLHGVEHARAWAAFVAGDVDVAQSHARAAAGGSLGAERKRQLALAARCSLWLGDRAEAADVAEELAASSSGRATEATLLGLAAGLAGLDGAPDARARYRAAADAWRQLDLPLHLALCHLDAHRVLAEREPEAEAIGLLEILGADGLLRLIGRARPPPPARSRPPRAGIARRKDAGHRTPRETDRRAPSG